MHSSKVRLETVAAPGNLREAFLRAAKGKSCRAEVVQFRRQLDGELCKIRADLLEGTLQPGSFSSFTIYEPKDPDGFMD